MTFLDKQILGNSAGQWLTALLMVAGISGAVILIRNFLARYTAPEPGTRGEGLSGIFSEIIARTKVYVLLLAALYPASMPLELPGRVRDILANIAFISLVLQFGIWGSYFVSSGIRRYMGTRTGGAAAADSGITVMTLVGRAALWVFIFLVILENIGVNVATLIASLGVAGIAIGLATQNILGDLFAALSILLDKPFEVGHFIIVGDHLGTVEKIGLKTTRLRSLSGELLVFGNSDLLQSRIRNFTDFRERRVVFTFGVRYDTPADKLEKIPGIISTITENIENTRFDRAHFKAFGDFSLDFEVVYYVLSPDYLVYMDTQEKINLEIFREFEYQDIQFAFPTRTVHIAGVPGTDLSDTKGEG
ncbi:MAG: mechanosensitive ion channel family protein [Desulfosalsimonas sp.]